MSDYHIHSNFSDGKDRIDEIAQFCSENGIEEIAITDHVRKKLSYSFSDYLKEIEDAKQKYHIRIWRGIEAKILPDGQLDMPDGITYDVDFIIGSIHGWPKEIPNRHAYELLVKTPATVIGHVKYLDKELIEHILKNHKILEINHQYPLSKTELSLIAKYPELKISFGSNAHSIQEIIPAQKYFHDLLHASISKTQVWKVE